jgi:hypothetical protein
MQTTYMRMFEIVPEVTRTITSPLDRAGQKVTAQAKPKSAPSIRGSHGGLGVAIAAKGAVNGGSGKDQ